MRPFYWGVSPRLLLLLGCLSWGCGTPSLEGPLVGSEADSLACDRIAGAEPMNIAEQIERSGITDSTATWAYVLEEGEEAIFTRAWLGQNSERSIDIQYFIFSMDNVGIIALDYLLRAADRGVKVRMLVDDIMLDVSEEDVLALSAHPNFEIRIYNPNPGKNGFQKVIHAARDFRGFNQRMHNKTFIVDGRVAITGGRNIADEYFDYDQEYNFRDRDVMLIGAAAATIQQSFESFWSHPLAVEVDGSAAVEADHRLTLYDQIHAYACDPDNFWPEIRTMIAGIPQAIPRIQSSGRLHRLDDLQFVSDVPGKNASDGFYGGGRSTSALVDLVEKSRESLMIQSPYLVLTDEGIALFESAVNRGVKVTILTNSLCSTDNLEAFSGYRRIRERLLSAGVEVYEYRPDAAIRTKLITATKQQRSGYLPTFGLHAKSMVVDHATTVIGTFNLDPRSANLNTECVAIMRSKSMSQQVESLMFLELEPENAWRTTADENPDHHAGWWKLLTTWIRGVVPAHLL